MKMNFRYTKRTSQTDRYFSDINQCKSDLCKDESEMSPHELFMANKLFAVAVAKQYVNRGIPLEDLIQESNLGMLVAASRFDHTRGFKFISYAVFYCRCYILKALKDNSIIHLPEQIYQLNLENKVNQLANELGRLPDITELQEVVDRDISNFPVNLTTMGKVVSYEKCHDETLEYMNLESVPDNEPLLDLTYITKIAKSLLSERDYNFLIDFFGVENGNPMTNYELSIKYNLTEYGAATKGQRVVDSLKRKLIALGIKNGAIPSDGEQTSINEKYLREILGCDSF